LDPDIVVVADDSTLARKQLIKTLPADWEVTVREAKDGQQALEAFDADARLLFLDLTMPEMDGFQVLERLGADDGAGAVIVVSADIQPKAVEKVKELGALAFLRKPVDAEELQQVLTEQGFL
jgi:CheY-like chemotaxis protein